MKIGGYQIIDLKNRNLQPNVGMVYEGIYELIEGTRKPILVSGLQINGIEIHDVFADFINAEGAFVAYVRISGLTVALSVTDVDVVTAQIELES